MNLAVRRFLSGLMVGAILLALAGCTPSPALQQARAGACPLDAANAVTVVVGSDVRCVRQASGMTGLQALAAAGFRVIQMQQQPGAICQLDGHPAGAECTRLAPGGYWNYWIAEPGATDWSYALQGPGNRTVITGGAEGWAFGDRVKPGWSPANRSTAPLPGTQQTQAQPQTQPNLWLTGLLLLVAALGLGGAIAIGRRNRNKPRAEMHTGAWWLWALGAAAAASRTLNPLILLLLIAVMCAVVANRRSRATWASNFKLYLWLGGIVVLIRVLFRLLFAGGGATVLLNLPQLTLPSWLTGMQLLGPISAEALLGAFYGGLQLAAIIICFGAANTLANPRRLVSCVPAALYEISTVLVIALSVFPQLASSAKRVNQARKLRRASTTNRRIGGLLIPVLADALDRSVALAAAMDARGFGRRSAPASRYTSWLLAIGMCAIAAASYWLLAETASRVVGVLLLLAGLVIAGFGLRAAGAGIPRTRYRKQPWLPADTALSACGLGAAAVLLTSPAAGLHPGSSSWPLLAAWPVVALLLLLTALAVSSLRFTGRQVQ